MGAGAILKGALALGQMGAGMYKTQRAKQMGASLVDPNQQAMLNATKRMFRAGQTGTSSFADRRMLASDAKAMARRSMAAGGRSAAPYLKMMRDADANIRATAAGRAGELLGSIVKQTQDISDRRMDLLEQEKAQMNLEGQAAKQTGMKNLFAVAPSIGDEVGAGKGSVLDQIGGLFDKRRQRKKATEKRDFTAD
jgi:hypothetical protein